MKNLLLLFLLELVYFHSFSQKIILLGDKQEEVYPFESNHPTLYFDWMKSQNNFSNIDIIGMGEATHGTKNFFEIKAKTFEFLATNYQYKIFGIEASYGGCCYINDYVTSGIGNIDSVLLNFDYWIWRTQEVKELVLWIKNYNQQHPDSEKITFYGFDTQNIFSPISYFNRFLILDKNINHRELNEMIHPILSKSKQHIEEILQNNDSKFKDTLLSTYKALKEWLNLNKPYLEKQYSAKQYQRLDFCIDNYYQAIKRFSPSGQQNDFALQNERDSCMALNILRIQKMENSKLFIWAHNGHINFSYPNNKPKSIGLPMGERLKNVLGQKYYAIGFVFNQGNFQARQGANSLWDAINRHYFAKNKPYDIKECIVPSYKKNTLTFVFSKTSLTSFFIDLSKSSNPLFTSTQHTYDVGSMFFKYKSHSEEIIPKKQFDGLIYVDKTSRAIPLEIK